MIRLIINADDFGYNEGRTRAILNFFGRGLVSNTTLMVNMPYTEPAVRLAKDAGIENKIGLHLNITEGEPITDRIKELPLFCDEHGKFNKIFHTSKFSRLKLPKMYIEPLREELKAQLERYLEFGLTEMHIDSHHHAHNDFAVANVLFPLAKNMGFNTVRIARNIGTIGAFKRFYKKVFNKRAKCLFGTADCFGDLKDVEISWDKLDGKIVEVMTHPIRCDNGFMSPEPDNIVNYETCDKDIASFIDKRHDSFELKAYSEI